MRARLAAASFAKSPCAFGVPSKIETTFEVRNFNRRKICHIEKQLHLPAEHDGGVIFELYFEVGKLYNNYCAVRVNRSCLNTCCIEHVHEKHFVS